MSLLSALSFFADHVAQNETVLSTLDQLNIPTALAESMITVGNKIDLVRVLYVHYYSGRLIVLPFQFGHLLMGL